MDFDRCTICGQQLDGEKATVVLGSGPAIYQPFMEDWRGGMVPMTHPECFAEERGVPALVEAVAREDARRVGRRFD